MKRKLILQSAQILGLIGTTLAIWAMVHIVRYPLPKPATPSDAFKFCLGFGFIGIAVWATILLIPKNNNSYSDTIGKVIAWVMGLD